MPVDYCPNKFIDIGYGVLANCFYYTYEDVCLNTGHYCPEAPPVQMSPYVPTCAQGYTLNKARDGCDSNLTAALHKASNTVKSLFGFDEDIPLPSCLAIGLGETINRLNPFPTGSRISVQDAITGISEVYQSLLYSQLYKEAWSQTFYVAGFHGVTANISAIGRKLAAKTAAANTYTFGANILTAEWGGLMTELDVMNAGGCQ